MLVLPVTEDNFRYTLVSDGEKKVLEANPAFLDQFIQEATVPRYPVE